ncbi:hypothetical protein EON62_06210 [archaeon]|nr:MAG: hypothetical protein EON62_06210 [archaeon]
MKELAGDETSYRSITESWFEHSPLHQALKKIADKQLNIVHCADCSDPRSRIQALPRPGASRIGRGRPCCRQQWQRQ